MEKIEIMVKQAELLLEKQKEVEAFFRDQFDSLNSFLDEEIKKYEKARAGQDLISFQNVIALLSHQEETIMNALAEDIIFLKEQCSSVKEIKAVKDKEKREELADLLLDGEEIITDMAKFEEDAEKEAADSRESIVKMMEETKLAVVEDRIEALEEILEQSMASYDEEECSGAHNGACHSCCSECDLDEPIKKKS